MVTGGHIVGAGVTEHIVEGFSGTDVFARLADDDGQLTLVVDLVAGQMRGDFDGLLRMLERVDAFDEEDGALR